MTMTGPVNPELAPKKPDICHSPAGMHRPQHGECESEETACHDEVLHDAALRDSSLRTPR
jgi:hypothetical protein